MALYEQFLPESWQDPEKRTGNALVDYLTEHPDATGNFRLGELDSGQLCRLLSACPRFVDRCDIGKIRPEDTCAIIVAQPDLVHRLKPKKPEWVLCHQPGLWSHSPFHDFDSLEWSQLIREQPTLAEKCPWDRLNFIRPWRDSLLLHPEVVLAHREDWAPFHHVGGYSPEDLAPLIARKPELCEEVDLTAFGAKEWITILMSQPQLIERCDVGRIFRDPPVTLLAAHPELAGRFDWSKCSQVSEFFDLPSWPELFRKFTREQPELADVLIKNCSPEDWEHLLPKYPEYLLEHNGDKFLFPHNVRALLLAGFPDFDGAGLDSICNNYYDEIEKPVPDPTGWFEEGDFSSAEFLIRSVMDPTNAKRFLLRKIRMGQWEFCAKLLDCDPEAMYRFLPRARCAFLLCSAAPDTVWKKYLTLNEEALSFRDKNGNTLLHAALLRAVSGRIDTALIPGKPARKLYDFLIGRGCDPDRKNKRGVSCSDLLAVISEKVDLWTEKLCQ